MMSLYQTLSASPDLTAVQAKALATHYLDEMKENHEFAISINDLEAGTHRGGEKGIADELIDKETLDESVSILDL
jgi:hypothetical protein